MTVSTVLREKKTIGDLIRMDFGNLAGYTRKSVRVYNRTGSTIILLDPIGYPVKVDGSVAGAYKLAVYGDEANVKGLIAQVNRVGSSFASVANNAYVQALVLIRGPVIIDKDQMPTTDVSGGTFEASGQAGLLTTALEALNPPILCSTEHVTTTTQTT